MQRTFNSGFKQFLRATPSEILGFVKMEVSSGYQKDMGDYDTLSPSDLRAELCFKIMLGSRMVGFATAKYATSFRRLLRIYITPNARRHGCASWVLQEMRVTDVNVPVRNAHFLGLCRKKGFTYNARQAYPTVAELSRPAFESVSRGKHNPVPAYQLG